MNGESICTTLLVQVHTQKHVYDAFLEEFNCSVFSTLVSTRWKVVENFDEIVNVYSSVPVSPSPTSLKPSPLDSVHFLSDESEAEREEREKRE